ncbi:MAG: hypothetical protein GWN51_02145, partial [Gemmatimonadetes bacterium]|nr:hypothetical protein [Gemmatimonadota bacterium]NIT65695.1 hypothetical protein [Gemmatimonadota bacterium]NIV22452.1 hypothetical protein [Gemmatimonadota bacterium]NIW74165.1 hypothetical protein [Gemmatimonadota bacterium]NIY34273.1 hypothetical protein [Gemmatimonadota bacterium]
DLDAGGRLQRRPTPELPASVPVNVVVGGRLEPRGSDAVRAAEGLRRIFRDLESR